MIFSKNGGNCRVKAVGLKKVEGMEGIWDETHKIYKFVTEPGKEYHLLFGWAAAFKSSTALLS